MYYSIGISLENSAIYMRHLSFYSIILCRFTYISEDCSFLKEGFMFLMHIIQVIGRFVK